MTRVLFISMSAQIIKDYEGNFYTNSHINRNIILRYASLCDEFVMLLRDSGIRLSKDEAEKSYNRFPDDLAKLVVGFNPYKPLTNYLKLSKRRDLDYLFEEYIKNSDAVIFNAASGYYTDNAIKYCKKYKKRYLLINGGFAYENSWYHRNPLGKIMAPISEHFCKKNLLNAPYALYVTDYTLQNRYPCNGKSIGCSDVELCNLDYETINNRLQKITDRKKNKIVFGTAAHLDQKNKGQIYVIRALSEIKKRGIGVEFSYQLIGGGNPEYLLREVRKLGLENEVNIIGSLPHEEVYDWLDDIDVYIQPSFSEGLCRSIIEAMSRGCPVIASSAGGNIELVEADVLFEAGNMKEIIDCMLKINEPNFMYRQSIRNFKFVEKFETRKLEQMRTKFLVDFYNGI